MASTLAQQLRDQAVRLMRTDWSTATLLGQELYTMLLSMRDDTTGPVTVSPTPDGNDPFTLPPFPDLSFPPIDFDFPDIPAVTQEPTQTDPEQNQDKTKISFVVFRNAVPGQIVSGFGRQWQVRIFPNGIVSHQSPWAFNYSGVAQSIVVPAVTLDQDETLEIEPGTWISPVYRTSGARLTETLSNTVTGENRRTNLQYLFIDHCFKAPSFGGGGGIPCKIIEGTGNTYTAELYENGIDEEPTQNVEVTQLQINEEETIPPETWTFASKIGDTYYIQVPVFLS